MLFLYVALSGFLVLMAYIRFSSVEMAEWHAVPIYAQDKTYSNGIILRRKLGPKALQRLDALVDTEPRTDRFAGTPEEGMVTYVTRSRFFGFPDYTTVLQSGDDLIIHARSRFGKSDFGVNAERVNRWLAPFGGQ